MTVHHPRKNDQGLAVVLKAPSIATPPDYWSDPGKTAIAIPDGQAPDNLNGIPCNRWQDHPTTLKEWESLAATMPIAEPPLTPPKGFKLSAGVVILEPDGRIWLTSPSNGFGGYLNTFPKGTLDGKSPKAAALAEVFEGTGLRVRLIGHLIDVTKSTSHVRYYLGIRTGGRPTDMGWESQATILAPHSVLPALLNNAHDHPIIRALNRYFTASRLVKSDGGVMVRVLSAIIGYKNKFGQWPTEIKINQETLNAIFENHLTEDGKMRLLDFITFIPTSEVVVIARSGDQEFDYGNEVSDYKNGFEELSNILGIPQAPNESS